MTANPPISTRLSVPERLPAGDDSFPTEPAEVIDWLKQLDTEAVPGDRNTLLHGIRHSNRLQMPPASRRRLLELFQPLVDTLYPLLAASSREQPLPLSPQFRRENELLASLQRECAYLCKILVIDSLEAPEASDHALGLQALARQAEAARLAYQAVPSELLREAHTLFQHAEQHKLLRINDHGPAIGRHYRYLLLLARVDLQQIRNRQLPLVLRYLSEHARRIAVTMRPQARAIRSTDYAVDLNNGTSLAPASSLLPGPEDALCWVDLRPLITQLNQDIRITRTTYSSLLHSDAMERQTLVRLQNAAGRDRVRRQQRAIVNAERTLVMGLQNIHAALRYSDDKEDAMLPEDLRRDNPGWIVLNESQQGLALDNLSCSPGQVQVGELVLSLPQIDNHRIELDQAMLSVVRWLHCHDTRHVRLGVEHLARGVMPVSVKPSHVDEEDSADRIPDDAIIMACRIQGQPTQTILMPAFRYQAGDSIEARVQERTSCIKLKQCLQANELYSHFALAETPALN